MIVRFLDIVGINYHHCFNFSQRQAVLYFWRLVNILSVLDCLRAGLWLALYLCHHFTQKSRPISILSMCAVYDNNLKIIKPYISNLMRVTRFWNTLHQVRAKSEDWKANNAKVFDSKKTKGPTQDSQNRLCLPVPDGGEL